MKSTIDGHALRRGLRSLEAAETIIKDEIKALDVMLNVFRASLNTKIKTGEIELKEGETILKVDYETFLRVDVFQRYVESITPLRIINIESIEVKKEMETLPDEQDSQLA